MTDRSARHEFARPPFRLSLVLLGLALAYVVANGGGRTAVEWYVGVMCVAALAALHWLRASPGAQAPGMSPPLTWFVALAPALVLFQLMPLPVPLLRVLSPQRAVLVDNLGAVMPRPVFAPISINPAVTLAGLATVVVCGLTFLLVRELTWRSRASGSWMPIVPLIAIACIEAAVGVFQAETGTAVVEGTFRSPDHFAGFLEMVLPLALTSALALVALARQRPARATRTLLFACVMFVCTTAMLVALIYSLSRMGFVAGLGGLAATALLSTLVLTESRRSRWLGIGALTFAVVAGVILLPTDSLIEQFAALVSINLTDARWPIWSDTMRLIRDYPWLGSGFGTYGTAFLAYQAHLVDVDFTYAHNDYLQLAAETGLAGVVLFVGLIGGQFLSALRAAARSSEWHTRALGIGCVGAMVAIGLHSLADFNLEIPANALLLAWICGVASGASSTSTARTSSPWIVRAAIASAVLLLAYAPFQIVREVSAQEIDTTAPAVLSVANARDAVRREPAAPYRWCDLGAALAKVGDMGQARAAFAQARALGPEIPPVLLKTAAFDDERGDRASAFAQTSRILTKTNGFDKAVFEWFWTRDLAPADVLGAALGSDPRATRAYFHDVLRHEGAPGIVQVWDWLIARHAADDEVARDYVNFQQGAGHYEVASTAWARYVGDDGNGYPTSNLLFNGSFERAPSKVPFDWRLNDKGDDVTAALDAGVAHTGTRSLRLRFAGKDNVGYQESAQVVVVEPGTYRFSAYVKTDKLTTDSGVAFRIAGGGVNVRTDQVLGTAGWTRIERLVEVPADIRTLEVRVVREKSLKFDSLVSGTAWVDSISLTKVE